MSREYLQGLVERKKQEDYQFHLSEVVKDISQKIGAAASTGARCYLYDLSQVASREAQMRQVATENFHSAQRILGRNESRAGSNGNFTMILPPILAPYSIQPHDVVNALKVKCPGCDVSYQEKWVQSSLKSPTQTLKWVIYISWE